MRVCLILLGAYVEGSNIAIFKTIVLLFLYLVLSISLGVRSQGRIRDSHFDVCIAVPANDALRGTSRIIHIVRRHLTKFPRGRSLVDHVQRASTRLALILGRSCHRVKGHDVASVGSSIRAHLHAVGNTRVSLSRTKDNKNEKKNNSKSVVNNVKDFVHLLNVNRGHRHVIVGNSSFSLVRQITRSFHCCLSRRRFVHGAHISCDHPRPRVHLNFSPVLLASCSVSHRGVTSNLASLGPRVSSKASFGIKRSACSVVVHGQAMRRRRTNGGQSGAISSLHRIRVPDTSNDLRELRSVTSIGCNHKHTHIAHIGRSGRVRLFCSFSHSIRRSESLLRNCQSSVSRLISNCGLPSNITIRIFRRRSVFTSFGFLLLTTFVLVFVVLTSIFRSFIAPFILLFSVPLTTVNSLLTLLLANGDLLGGTGIVVKFLVLLKMIIGGNVVLVSCTGVLHQQNCHHGETLVATKLSHVHPVLVASVAAVMTVLPVTVNGSRCTKTVNTPFTVAIVNNLSFSTLLALVLVPAIYVKLRGALR